MDAVLEAIRSLPPELAYAIIAALVFGEAAVFLGFVFPGETAVLLGGFLASQGHLDISLLCVIVFLSAVAGDSVGYEVGKHYGPRLIGLKAFDRFHARLDRAQQMLKTRGGPAVFLGRFTAFFRAVMPALAGLSQMAYRTFLPWNALGGLLWGVGFCLVGYFAGESYERVAKEIGTGAAVVIALLAIVALIVWQVRRKRRDQAEEAEWEAEHSDGADSGEVSDAGPDEVPGEVSGEVSGPN